MSRVLTARPSNAEDMAPWQITLSNKLQDLLQEAHLKRTVLTHFIQSFPRPTGEEAIEEVTMAIQIAYNMTTGPAEARARQLMQPGQADYIGTRPTCILMWSMADHSPVAGPKRQ